MITMDEALVYLQQARVEAQLRGDLYELEQIMKVQAFLIRSGMPGTSDVMITLEQALSQAERKLDLFALYNLRGIIAFLMQPADLVRDRATLRRFRLLVDRAAFSAEQIELTRKLR
jgi:hypothetical protein